MLDEKESLIARKSMPSPLASSGDIVQAAADVQGRQVVYPYQVRDLVSTAYVSLSTNTETTLLAAAAGQFLDLMKITAANLSTAVLGAATSVQLDFRDTTGGPVIYTMMINDDVSQSDSFTLPVPQSSSGNTWTVQMANGDLSGTTVKVSALFIQNA